MSSRTGRRAITPPRVEFVNEPVSEFATRIGLCINFRVKNDWSGYCGENDEPRERRKEL